MQNEACPLGRWICIYLRSSAVDTRASANVETDRTTVRFRPTIPHLCLANTEARRISEAIAYHPMTHAPNPNRGDAETYKNLLEKLNNNSVTVIPSGPAGCSPR